jgi:hypothetical protein
MENASVTVVVEVIRLSVAPVFLLVGLGGMLSVMTNRLGRTVDRARVLRERISQGSTDSSAISVTELSVVSRRLRLINRSITLCTFAALLICTVIGTLFVGTFLKFDTSTIVAVLFLIAMVSFFLGLLTFLWEILIAGATLRAGIAWTTAPQPHPAAPPTEDSVKEIGQ